jgi:hypothetical protein
LFHPVRLTPLRPADLLGYIRGSWIDPRSRQTRLPSCYERSDSMNTPLGSFAARDVEPDRSNDIVLLGAYLIGLEVIVASFSVLDWEHGIARGCILFGLLFALILFRIYGQPWRQVASDVPGFVKILLLIAGLSCIGASAHAIQKSLRTHKIELDAGETTWRAARMLWLGQNPYGYRAVVDHAIFLDRLEPLAAAGLAPTIPKPELLSALKEYDRTLDPNLQRRLLPIRSDNTPRPLEARVLGYKYGPLVMLVTAPFVPLGVPAVIPALNIAGCFGLFAAMFWVMRDVSRQLALAIVGLIALLVDPSIRWNFILLTATDVWPLLSSSLAVLNFRRGKMNACAIFLALACGFKIFPSTLLLPLLLTSRSPWPIALFVSIVIIIYAPWFLWDPIGILDNVFLWPALASPHAQRLDILALLRVFINYPDRAVRWLGGGRCAMAALLSGIRHSPLLDPGDDKYLRSARGRRVPQ